MKNLPLILFILFFSLGSIADENDLPNIGDPLGKVLSLEDEKIIGFSSYRRLQKYNLINNDPLVNSYIKYLGNVLTRHTLDARRQYTFFVTKSNQINAFAVPGGYIGINSGLIQLTQNESQLAGVLAHETAHVNLRHSAEMLANTSRLSFPIIIGVIAGIFSGSPQASIAAMQSGLGLSTQLNINLIRSNEIEADEFAISLMKKSNFSVLEMANFFELMQSATPKLDTSLAYFMTHPLYENRIARIRSKSTYQHQPIINTSNDYNFIKVILDVNDTTDVQLNLSSIKGEDIYNLYKKALLYNKKSDYKNSIQIFKKLHDKNPYNIYIAISYAKALIQNKRIDDGLDILDKLKQIYPLNNSIPFYLAEALIENDRDLNRALDLMKSIETYQKLNPDYLRLVSKVYVKKNDIYNSKLFLSDYYLILDNIKLSVQVLDEGINSYNLNKIEKKNLADKKLLIICTYQKPLEPIFGEKTCY
ncbi:MAG: hypothetical protein CMD88_03065 [Gammaproteobacteria bacterium]|nr:hypothetical protein [Gammaproteobacteria bacterium]|tara:strand:- start:71114 stop:72541 length:1428 start_codon:yes stop_codon:yes gene_type:complete